VLGKLLGIELDRRPSTGGTAFVTGVLERAGEEGLARLWESPSGFAGRRPEVDAPGLWLARTELPDQL